MSRFNINNNMQHNTWSKDRDDLASLTHSVITEGSTDPDADYFKAHDELPESQDDLDNFKANKSEDAENPEVFQLLASVGELDAVSMEEFLHGLANIFDDPDVTDRAFELTFGHIGDAYDAFKNRASN